MGCPKVKIGPMFQALALGVFFVLLVTVRRRNRLAAARTQRLQVELSETQQVLEKIQHRNQQIVGLLTELHEYKVSPVGRVSWTDLADFTVQTAAALVGAQTVLLLKLEPDNGEFRGIAGRGISPKQLADLRVRPGEGVLGRAVQSGKVLEVNTPGSIPH